MQNTRQRGEHSLILVCRPALHEESLVFNQKSRLFHQKSRLFHPKTHILCKMPGDEEQTASLLSVSLFFLKIGKEL